MPVTQKYTIDEEFFLCLDALYDLLDFLDDIKLALELDEDLGLLIHTPIVIPPAFDPFETIY
jgi:hypothetical protein